MGADRDKTGQFTPEHTDAEILAAVRAHEPAATSEVSDELGLTRQGADRRLRRLRDEGRVSSKKIAASLVWFAPEQADEERRETGRDAARSDPGNESGEDTDSIEGDARPESDDAILAVVERVAEGWDDTTARLGARKAAARAVLEYAREHGTVSKQEAKEDVRPEYPVDGQNDRTWYRKNVRPVLNEAAEYDQSAKAYRLTLGERDT